MTTRPYFALFAASVLLVWGLYVAFGRSGGAGLLTGAGAGLGVVLAYAVYDGVRRGGEADVVEGVETERGDE